MINNIKSQTISNIIDNITEYNITEYNIELSITDNITEYNKYNENKINDLTLIVYYQFGIGLFILNYLIIYELCNDFTAYLIYFMKQCCMFSLYLVNYQELVNIEEHNRFHILEHEIYNNHSEIKNMIKKMDYKLEKLYTIVNIDEDVNITDD
jgi:hypothetical protein